MTVSAEQTTPYWYAGHLFEYLLDAEDTGGSLALMRVTARPGFDPPAHVHANEDEVFHILEGHASFRIGERVVSAGPGDTVWLPRGVPHAPRFDSEVVRCLLMVTPAAGAAHHGQDRALLVGGLEGGLARAPRHRVGLARLEAVQRALAQLPLVHRAR